MKQVGKTLWSRDIVRYWVVANIAAVVDVGLFWLLTSPTDIHYLAAATISWFVGTAVNYSLCVLWVFESGARFGRKKEVAALYIVNAVSLGIHHLALWFYVNDFGWNLILAKILAMFTAFAWGYTSRKYWVFRDNPQRAE